MDENQKHPHFYLMKKHWQCAYRLLGLSIWSYSISAVYVSRILSFIFPWDILKGFLWDFPWERRVIPAFRKIIAGEWRSYLRISENGFVYRNWPLFEMRCKWEDVEFNKKNGEFDDTLYINHFDGIGLIELSISLNRPQISLRNLIGWKEGELKDDLWRYVSL